jgi:O-antigen ligase
MLLIDQIIYYLFLTLFTATPFIIFHLTSELFEFNKIIFIYIIATLIFFFWILKSILLKKIIIKKTYLDKAIIFFLISQLLSTLFSIDRHTSFFGFYGRFNGGLLSIIIYIGLYYALISNLTKDNVIKILKLSVFVGFLVVLIGLPGKFNHDLLCFIFTKQLNNGCWTEQFKPAERMFSTLGQPNWLGAYLTINLFLSLYFFLTKNKKSTIGFLFNLITLTIIFIGVLFSRSRSAILSLFIGYLILLGLIFLLKKTRWSKNIALKNLTYLSIILFSLTIVFKTGINQIDRLISINFTKKEQVVNNNQSKNAAPILVTESFDIRKIVWKGALELGKRYPLFGTGVETFGYAYYFTRPKEHNLTSEWDYLYNKAHNEYLNYLATTGFFGLAAYLFLILYFLFYVFKQLFKNEDLILKLVFAASYLSILITNFFGFSTTTINLFFYLIPAMFFLLTEKEDKQNKKDDYPSLNFADLNFNRMAYLFVLIILALFAVFYFISYWLADFNYARALKYSAEGQKYNIVNYYSYSIFYFKKALDYKYEPIYEDKLSSSLANLAFLLTYQKDSNVINDLIKDSQYYNQKSIDSSPKNILYLKTKVKNNQFYYYITNEKKFLDEAISTLLYAKKIAPSDPKIPYSTAVLYSLILESEKYKSDKLLKEFLKVIDEAIDLKPNYRDAYFLKGKILTKIDQKPQAKETFRFILQNINPKDQEVIDEIKKIN